MTANATQSPFYPIIGTQWLFAYITAAFGLITLYMINQTLPVLYLVSVFQCFDYLYFKTLLVIRVADHFEVGIFTHSGKSEYQKVSTSKN